MDDTNIQNTFRFTNKNEKFDSKEIDILSKIKHFFSFNHKYVNTLLSIINGDSDISIRIIDWCVANYAKKFNTYYFIKNNEKIEYFYVFNEYKIQLNSYSKTYFDPFCRKKKIKYFYKSKDLDVNFISSIGQLNFFKWAISNKIINYVMNNNRIITHDMKNTNIENQEKKSITSSQSPTSGSKDDSLNINYDPEICSSDNISSMCISPMKKNISSTQSDSETKHKRHQLSKSVYDYGIKKTNISISLDFD